MIKRSRCPAGDALAAAAARHGNGTAAVAGDDAAAVRGAFDTRGVFFSLSLPWLAPASHAYIAAALHEFRRVPRLLNDVSTRADVEMRGELLFSARRRRLLYFPEEEVFFVLGVDGFLFPFFLKVEFCLGEDDGWKFRRAPPDALPTSSFSFSLGAFVCVCLTY